MPPRGSARVRLIERVQQEWTALQHSLGSLPEPAFFQPGVVGDWSLRDLMVHITSWEGEALKAIPIILQGRRLPRYRQLYGGIDAFNASEQQAKTHLLLSRLNKLPDDSLVSGGRLVRRLRQDTFAHYHEHTLHVVEWRQQRGI